MSNAPMQQIHELFPPAGDPGLGFKVFLILDSIMKDKNQLALPTKWNRNYELYKNKHWRNTNSKKASLVTANILFTHVNRTCNMLTDNNPTFNIAKIGQVAEETNEIYEKLLKTAEYWWTDQEQQSVLERSVKNGEIYGTSIEKIIFNPEAEFGLGEVETEIVDPYHFGFFPIKCRDIQKAEAIFHFRPMSLREIKRRWPQTSKGVKSDSEYLKELGDVRREAQANTASQPKGYFATFGGVVKNFMNESDSLGEDSEETLVVECWVKDYSMDENDNPIYTGFIRQLTVCSGGKIILEDRENPSINPNLPPEQARKTYLYDKFPFTFTCSNDDSANAWGMSDFEQLEQLQIEIDKSLSQITTFKDKVSRTKLINPKDSGVKNAEFTNYLGVINPTNQMSGQGIRYLDPPALPSDLMQVMQLYKDYFFLVSGSFELEQAQTPGREVIAHKAIATLIERASTMLKGKIRNYGKMIRERGRAYLSHVMNWYTEDRWITFEENGQEISETIRGSELIIPAKLTVVSGSTMPRSKIQEREEAISLYKDGAIDNKALLEKMDWPNRNEIIQRMQAGPFGELFDKLMQIGVPEQLIQVFQEISQMEDKEFKSSLEKGEMPPFMQLIEQVLAGQEQPEAPPDPAMEMEVQVKSAQVEKLRMETALIQEKIRTEQVDQQVKVAGVQFDEEKLKIERAQTVAAMKAQEHQQAVTEINTAEQVKNNEASNNHKIKELDLKSKDSELKGKSAEKTTQGPYQEKGMKSNNQDKK